MKTNEIKAALALNETTMTEIATEAGATVGLVSQVVSRKFAASGSATKTRRIQEVVAAKINTPFAKVWPESAEAV